ncbi:hypothetical protein [Aeoliella sp.]|uniref:hypothetical protein n=1 Tax=Aeoliella sp. TaxID=2795800 RepID=UPI003CCBD793
MDGWKDDAEIRVPPGKYLISVRYGRTEAPAPFFSKIVQRVRIENQPKVAGTFHVVREVGVDMAKITISDAQDLRDYIEHEGKKRVGYIYCDPSNPENGGDILQPLLKDKYGLAVAKESRASRYARIEKPISKELERSILEDVESIPRFSRNSFMYFHVETANTFDRVNRYSEPYGMMPIDSAGSAAMAVVQSGYGDGSYPVSLCQDGAGGVCVQVDFEGTYTEDFVKSFAN